MANAPKFLAPDGVYRELYIFTTDQVNRFFTGSMDAATVDMQVSIRGSAFTSNPDLIYFEGTSFIIPNPSAYPQGLYLAAGTNDIQVKAILTSGAVTPTGVIQAILSLERDVRSSVIAPSGIYVERFDQRVRITVDGLDDDNVVGYNFYASTAPGGGSVGYSQLNLQMVITGASVLTYTTLSTLTTDATVSSNPDGTHTADPMYLRVKGTEESSLEVVQQTDFDQLLNIPETTARLRTTWTVEDVQTVTRYSFDHDRRATTASSDYPAIPNADFNSIPDTDPLYYVVTAVYLIDNQEYESAVSPEVAAAPLIVTPAVASLPVVARQQIVQDTTLSIFRSHPDVDIKAGSVLRDTFIDPFSTEAERIRFIINFLQASQVSGMLLGIDDPGNSGESIPVAQSAYKLALKQAFFLKDDSSVQAMIDNMFDHLAARRGVTRSTGTRAQGEVTFYVNAYPAVTIDIPIGTSLSGSGGTSYITTSAAGISATGGESFYNPLTGRYSARAYIQALSAGSAGNLSAGQIRSINNGVANVQVTNEAPLFGGTDEESNRDLAARADGVLSSVDSGTYRGYTQDAINVAGVRQVNVVDAGHSLMYRDYDAATDRHTGGKVDVWIRGDNLVTLTDSFAFQFETKRDGQFEPVGPVTDLTFRAVNSALSVDNPIIEMISLPTWGIEFIDSTTGQVFDLTGSTLIPPDQIQLDSTYNDPTNLHLTDIYYGTYRYRTSNAYTMTRQPVTEITSLVGEVTGTVTPEIYMLFHASGPLDLGRSSEAGDYMQVVQPLGSTTVVNIPSGDPIVVTDEQHVFLGGIEYLLSLGINPLTVHIYNFDKSTEYRGPYTPTVLGAKDFTFVDETGETPMGFRATSTARFVDGDTLLVCYEHDEVFVITYTSNSLVGLAQNAIDESRHVTADVLVKDSIPIGVNIKATVVVQKNQTISTVDGAIRTNLGRLFGAMTLGQPVRQSDIIASIDATTGVSYVVSPINTLCKSDGSQVVREELATEFDGTDYVEITDWSTNLLKVYLITQKLNSGTVDSGGEINDFKGVYQGHTAMTTYENAPDVNGNPINTAANGAFIIGNDGLNIPGYSDDATLQAAYPFATLTQIAGYRQTLTQRRVLITLSVDEKPEDAVYAAAYVVYDDDGVKNIEIGPTEYLELGDLEFTYDVDTDFEALVRGRN